VDAYERHQFEMQMEEKEVKKAFFFFLRVHLQEPNRIFQEHNSALRLAEREREEAEAQRAKKAAEAPAVELSGVVAES